MLFRSSGLFVLSSKLEINQVLWGCEPDSNQTSRNLYELLEQEGSLQTNLTPEILLSEGELGVRFQTGDEGLTGLTLQYGQLSAGLLMPGTSLGDWLGQPLCQRLTSESQPQSLYLDCDINPMLSDNTSNLADKEKTEAIWSELISDGSQIILR